MALADTLIAYNTQIGNVVPNIGSADVLDLCSLSDVIDNTKAFSFKVSLFPVQMVESLLGFDATSFTATLDSLESKLTNTMRQLAFYPKYNTIFEQTMSVPILNLDSITASSEIKTVFQIPIMVNYFILFNDTLNTLSRYYNSNVYFDQTGYELIPTCMMDQYNFNGIFTWNGGQTEAYPDPTIQNYGIDFTYMNNFQFVIEDMDIYSLRKNIVFFEIVLNSHIQNFLFYVIINNTSNVFLNQGNVSNLTYRKVFYNLDFINIKNQIVKYSN